MFWLFYKNVQNIYKNKWFENQLVRNYFINILKIIAKKFGSL